MQLTFLHILYINQLDVGLGWGGLDVNFLNIEGGYKLYRCLSGTFFIQTQLLCY